MNLVKQLRTWDEMPEYDSDSFHWLDLKTAEAADLIERQAAQIEMLREALEYCVTQVGELATVPGIASALSSTTEQSLAEYRNKVIEECAKRAEAYAYMSQNFNALAEELRAMKEQP